MGEAGRSKLGHVQLAEQDGSGRFQVRNHRGVFTRNKVTEYRRSSGGTDACGVDLVLDRHRDPVHGPSIFAPGQRLLRLPRGLQRLVVAHCQVGVELAIQVVNALQVGFHRLNGGYFLFPDDLGEFSSRQERYIGFLHNVSFRPGVESGIPDELHARFLTPDTMPGRARLKLVGVPEVVEVAIVNSIIGGRETPVNIH